MARTRWVLWKRPKGTREKWEFRTGRYESKEAATDAIRHLDQGFDWRALPEGKVPQDNLMVGGRRSAVGGEA